MLGANQIQTIAQLPGPLLTVYLNTQNPKASRLLAKSGGIAGSLRQLRKIAAGRRNRRTFRRRCAEMRTSS